MDGSGATRYCPVLNPTDRFIQHTAGGEMRNAVNEDADDTNNEVFVASQHWALYLRTHCLRIFYVL